MAFENQVQEIVHRLEEGAWKKLVLLGTLFAAVLALYTLLIFDPFSLGIFKGLSHPKAMEQAVIARELARGNGFTTKMYRPAAILQFQTNLGAIPVPAMPDTYYAPLWPATLAPFLKVAQSRWSMGLRDYVYVCDRIIAGVAAAIFLLAVGVNYLTLLRLFDKQLALLVVGMTLLCDLWWDYSLNGLPQSLMLLLFSGAVYLLVRAMEDQSDERPTILWLIGAAALFGLLALVHGIASWLFIGALIFCGIYFKPRIRTVLVMMTIFLTVYSPWLVRNYKVCGNPFGLAPSSALYQVRGTEGQIMRDMDFKSEGLSLGSFRAKIQNQVSAQIGNLFNHFGKILVAPLFFVALMHLFKRSETARFRWLLLLMWLFAVLGMAIFGSDDPPSELAVNDLHPLFIPMFSAYGLAFLLVLWTRLQINVALLRGAFLALIIGLSALPLANRFTVADKGVFNWPPYVPPYIAILGTWTHESEIIASDMPWAVAWYADRRSLWLPLKLDDFIRFNDYEQLGGHIAGLYLTPVSGNRAFINEIVKGEYKEWSPFILRTANVKDFPLKAVTALPIDAQCIFYGDRDRWTDQSD